MIDLSLMAISDSNGISNKRFKVSTSKTSGNFAANFRRVNQFNWIGLNAFIIKDIIK